MRALRRYHLARMKARAKEYYPWCEPGKMANNLKSCSCHMCGNPRKWFKEKTLQERKMGRWQNGYVGDCKSSYPGSIPGLPSILGERSCEY